MIGIPYRIDSSCLRLRLQQPCRLGHSLYRLPSLRKSLHFAIFPSGEKGKMRNFDKEGGERGCELVGRAVESNPSAACASESRDLATSRFAPS